MKKKVNENRGKGNISALSGAIKDLDVELKKLARDKSSVKQSLEEITSTMEGDHKKEKELQDKIAKLIEKEATLNQKKKGLQNKMDKVADKINKIEKIRSEMSDV